MADGQIVAGVITVAVIVAALADLSGFKPGPPSPGSGRPARDPSCNVPLSLNELAAVNLAGPLNC